ncbi:MAG TPA: hypothetical protein VFY33_01865 [Solirubrobacterales bacterium]|nr:hypothetical protein [Solirubrobacterales bacterium]
MAAGQRSHGLPRPIPGRLFRWVKLASWLELCLFAALLVFWLAPGFERETFAFGLAHGIGYIALCLLILLTIVRRQAPWPLLAATLTPLGPVGSVIGIELIERRGWGIGRDRPPERGESAHGY